MRKNIKWKKEEELKNKKLCQLWEIKKKNK